jgi:NAD(P)-dependent dehydrogenase (short-subunit alcohol dehydrogenase family)
MPQNGPWTADDIPDLGGKTAVVTGGNSGIGFEAARQMARKGAHVILACRDPRRAADAIAQIRTLHPSASLEPMQLDLASLESVHRFARDFAAKGVPLDVLCNNAGVMAIPRRTTAEGFEMQLGTNHLGHFALTGLLLEPLLAAPAARVVNVSSTAHKPGRIDFDDLQGEKRYRKWIAYAQSKLANLLFTYELQRRLEAASARAISLACHPGYSATNLQAVGPQMSGSRLAARIMDLGNRFFSQPAAMGALPTLYAATSPDARGGDYIGPDGFMENYGHPRRTRSTARSHDRAVARRLWEVSEQLTSVRYTLPVPPA